MITLVPDFSQYRRNSLVRRRSSPSGRFVDYRSDQFSFGSILHEMATGRLAFQKRTVPETQAVIMRDEPEPFLTVNSKVPVTCR